jgi:hypothetical protein
MERGDGEVEKQVQNSHPPPNSNLDHKGLVGFCWEKGFYSKLGFLNLLFLAGGKSGRLRVDRLK